MKKILIGLLLLIFMVHSVSAAKVCVVADYGKDSEYEPASKCIDTDEGMDGYYLLERTGWSLLWSPESMWGQMVCKINDIGTDIQGTSCYYDPGKQEFWNFVLVDGTKWGHSPVGLNGGDECWNRDFSWSDWSKVVHYCTKDGDVLGFAFGSAGAEPNMFKANISKVYVDGEKQTKISEGGGRIKEAFPESKIKFKIDLENLYDSSTDIDVNDISIKGIIEEIDDGDDIEKEIDEFDLDADKKTTEELEFAIPLEVEAKDRLLRITLKAGDGAGIKYEKEFTYDLEIQKRAHKLKITKAELNKESYKCGENALLSFSVVNIGTKEEDVKLGIKNDDLGLNINENFELSNDVFEDSSRYENKFNVWIPANLEKKAYPIEVIASYGAEKETANINLIVSECEGKVVASGEEVKGGKEVTSVQTEGQASEEEGIESEKEKETSGITVVKGIVTKNLPLFLTAALGGLIVIIISLGVGFWVVRK